jgi:CRP/FNR family cyclic AMP-dependent transcriptional regulator
MDGSSLPVAPVRDGPRLTLGYGTAAVRGLVRVEGLFDLSLIGGFCGAVEQLLAADVGEIWVDLRAAEEVAPIAAAALRRVRRRAARAGVALRLVLADGAVARALRRAGLDELATASPMLPHDLDHPTMIPLRRGRTTVRRGAAASLPGNNGASTAPSSHEPGPGTIDLLAVDPDLAAGMDALAVRAARHDLVLPAITIRRGAWRLPPGTPPDGRTLGLLVEGLVVRRVGHAGAFGAQLLGPGDLVGLDPGHAEEPAPGFTTHLRVLAPTRIAVLDAAFAERVRDHPAVLSNLLERSAAQAEALAAGLALVHYPRVERRLRVVLWQLAQRWGRVTQDGVVLTLPLTHAILADLTGTRRPSVTLALHRLEASGAVHRRGPDWVLRPEPPPHEHEDVGAAGPRAR